MENCGILTWATSPKARGKGDLYLERTDIGAKIFKWLYYINHILFKLLFSRILILQEILKNGIINNYTATS